jgi:hypothetical protein
MINTLCMMRGERHWVHYTVWGGVLSINKIFDAGASLPKALQDDQFQQSFTPHPINDFYTLLSMITSY